MRPFKSVRAADPQAAARAVAANPGARFLAGGTNLLDLMKEDVERPLELVDLTRLPELAEIREAAGGVPDHKLRRLGHDMHRTMTVVDELFGMALAEPQVVTGMAGVGAGGGVAAPQRRGHCPIRNRPLVATIADALELAVPGVSWRDPHLELDLRVAGRPRGRLDAAECRQRHGRWRAGRRERTGGHGGGGIDHHVGNGQRRQVDAGRTGGGRRLGRLGKKRYRRDEHTGEQTTDHGGSLQAGRIIPAGRAPTVGRPADSAGSNARSIYRCAASYRFPQKCCGSGSGRSSNRTACPTRSAD